MAQGPNWCMDYLSPSSNVLNESMDKWSNKDQMNKEMVNYRWICRWMAGYLTWFSSVDWPEVRLIETFENVIKLNGWNCCENPRNTSVFRKPLLPRCNPMEKSLWAPSRHVTLWFLGLATKSNQLHSAGSALMWCCNCGGFVATEQCNKRLSDSVLLLSEGLFVTAVQGGHYALAWWRSAALDVELF